MGRGDARTRRGKIFRGSFGKRRPRKKITTPQPVTPQPVVEQPQEEQPQPVEEAAPQA